MRKIILPDIFGVTDACQKLSNALLGDIEILNPYSEENIPFASESEAYSYFNSVTTIENYSESLKKKLAKLNGPVSLLGFSVGGSAIWHLAEHTARSHCTSALCYYAGQIRHNMLFNPGFPISLILAKKEEHFSVEQMAKALVGKPHTKVKHSRYLHGFMNQQSINFNPEAYKNHLSSLCQLSPEQAFIDVELGDSEDL